MIIIGCDFHPSFQQIAMLDTECGTTTEHKLMHTSGEAERFYRGLRRGTHLRGYRKWQVIRTGKNAVWGIFTRWFWGLCDYLKT